MRKILIYTAGTGGGHQQCAKVLQNKFLKQGYEVIIIDFLKEINPKLDKFIVGFNHLITSNFPMIYGHLYYGYDNEINQKRFINILIKISRNKLYDNLIKEKPDLIIGTHSFLNGIIGYLKENNLINIPFISLITDYKLHQNHIHNYIDGYITANEELSEEFEKRRIPLDRVYPYGIPIRDEFFKPKSHKKPEAFEILLMGGSLGLKEMKKALLSLSKINKNVHITVICGNNIKLKEYFEEKYKDLILKDKITVYGYFNEISMLMKHSNVLITKPGGITITEAITANLPIIVPYFIPGQEKENLKYLINKGLGIYIKDESDLRYLIEDLMSHSYILETIKTNMKELGNTNNTTDIVNLGERLINQYAISGDFK